MISILRDRLSVARALNVEVISLEQAPDAYTRFSAGQLDTGQATDIHSLAR